MRERLVIYLSETWTGNIEYLLKRFPMRVYIYKVLNKSLNYFAYM